MSSTCSGAHCSIVRENSYNFSKPSAYSKVVAMVDCICAFSWKIKGIVDI